MLSQKVRGKRHTEPVRVIKLLHSQQIVFLFLFLGGGVFISHLGGFLLFLLCSVTLFQEVHTIMQCLEVCLVRMSYQYKDIPKSLY